MGRSALCLYAKVYFLESILVKRSWCLSSHSVLFHYSFTHSRHINIGRHRSHWWESREFIKQIRRGNNTAAYYICNDIYVMTAAVLEWPAGQITNRRYCPHMWLVHSLLRYLWDIESIDVARLSLEHMWSMDGWMIKDEILLLYRNIRISQAASL